MPLHRNTVAPKSIHQIDFVGDTDPTLDANNHVGPWKRWLDMTDPAAPIEKIRNGDNDGWITIFDPGDVRSLEGRADAAEDALDDHEGRITALEGASGGGTPVTTQAGTSYTFDADDANSLVRFTSASAVTATVPTNASVAYAVGTTIAIEQAGAGAVTVAGDTGVTINEPPGGTLTTAGEHALVQVIKVGEDEWTLYGLVEAAS